jgi:peroxiredoxin
MPGSSRCWRSRRTGPSTSRVWPHQLHLPYRLLSDPQLRVADALDLPTFTTEVLPRSGSGQPQRLYKRLTMLMRGPRVEHVFYPVFPPDRHAEEVLDWCAPTLPWVDEHQGPFRGGGVGMSRDAAVIIR